MIVNISPKLIAPRDRARIDVTKTSDVRWWCDRLNQTEDELRAAVVAAGPLSSEVLFHLNNNRGREPRIASPALVRTAPLIVRSDLGVTVW